MSDTVTHDPELYARMSEPYETQEAAQAAVGRFLEAVAKLREEHRVAEVLVVAIAYGPGTDAHTKVGCPAMVGIGDAQRAPYLAAMLFQQYAGPLLEQADRVRAMAKGEKEHA